MREFLKAGSGNQIVLFQRKRVKNGPILGFWMQIEHVDVHSNQIDGTPTMTANDNALKRNPPTTAKFFLHSHCDVIASVDLPVRVYLAVRPFS